MKILFLIKSIKPSNVRIRVTNVLPILNKFGIETDTLIFPKKFFDKFKTYRKLRTYDLIVICRKLLSPLDLFLIKKYAKKIAYDFDDAVYYKSPKGLSSLASQSYYSRNRMRRFKKIVGAANIFFPANNILKKAVYNILHKEDKIYVIPSSVPAYDVPLKQDYNLSNPVIIGWVGSTSTLKYLEHIYPVFMELNSKINYELRIIANNTISPPDINIKFIPWNVNTQEFEISKFDIGIMPLTDDPYSTGKSAYKMLQYMASGVPSVCSSFGVNEELANGEKYCLGAKDNEEFYHQILKLVNDGKLRERIGKNARNHIMEHYSIDVVGKKLAKILLNEANKTATKND